MRRLASIIALCVAFCMLAHAQVTPSPAPTVPVSWTVPSAAGGWPGCSTAQPCTYVVSRASVASATSACPVTSGTLYTQVATSTSPSVTDTTVAGGNYYCWIIQTQWGTPVQTSQASQPSNATTANPGGVPLFVPGNPLPPGAPSASVIADNHPPAPLPTVKAPEPTEMASDSHAPIPLNVSAHVEYVRK